MYLQTLVVFSIITNLVWGYGSGAPSKSCENITPVHKGTIPPFIAGQTGPSIYTFSATWVKNLKMVRVSVSGEPVAGFLIQGRLREDGPAVGTFVNITENPDAKYQDCTSFKFDSQSSVTHTHPSEKQNLVFFWQPPKDMNKTENVTFYGTLARTKEQFWVMRKTDSLNLSALDNKPVPTKNTTSNKPVTQDGKVISRSTPTSKGSNATTAGVSLLSILLIITIKISTS